MANVTSFASDHPEFAVLSCGRVDRTPLAFGHAKHMDPVGFPQMQGMLTTWVESLQKNGMEEVPIGASRTVDGQLQLDCTGCHQLDAAGRYMQPIVFEEHCMHCHELPLQVLGAGRSERTPHGSGIEAFIRRIAFEQANAPKDPKKEDADARPPPGRRGRPRDKELPQQPEPAEEVKGENQRDALEQKVKEVTDPIRDACIKCHKFGDGLASIVDPMIPPRWLPRSRFSHEVHRFIRDCQECHAVAPPGPAPGPADLAWTGRTKDIMLPPIARCRECHSPDPITATAAARHDCAMCHDYHEPALPFAMGGAVAPDDSSRRAAPVTR